MSLPSRSEIDEIEALLENEWSKILTTGKLPPRNAFGMFYGHEQWTVKHDGAKYTLVLTAKGSDPLPDGSAGMTLSLNIVGGRLKGAAPTAGGPPGMDLTLSRDREMTRCQLPKKWWQFWG